MNVAVFCSQYDVAQKYMDVAAELARELARHGHTLVWGGANTGIMGLIARSAQEAGGRIVGVIRDDIKCFALESADEMHVVADVAAMNAGLIERADCIVVLPGGIGTLNELTDFLRMRKNKLHSKEAYVLNTDGFYNGFKEQIFRMAHEGFLDAGVSDSIHTVDAPAHIVSLLSA